MAEVIITTDGSIAGTILKVDGKEITKNNKVVSISMYASAPYRVSMTGDVYKGGSSVSYEIMGDNGVVERKSIGSDSTEYLKGIGQKIKQADQVTQYLGDSADVEITKLADAIVKHCSDNKLPCPEKEVLVTRTKESLTDKINDLGIKLEG